MGLVLRIYLSYYWLLYLRRSDVTPEFKTLQSFLLFMVPGEGEVSAACTLSPLANYDRLIIETCIVNKLIQAFCLKYI